VLCVFECVRASHLLHTWSMVQHASFMDVGTCVLLLVSFRRVVGFSVWPSGATAIELLLCLLTVGRTPHRCLAGGLEQYLCCLQLVADSCSHLTHPDRVQGASCGHLPWLARACELFW
jgi:hypothetical protein